MNRLDIQIISGNTAPRYDQGQELICEGVVITEQGMQSGLPLVDFKLRDKDGNFYLMVMPGRLVNALSAAIKGINKRIHGIEEP